MDSLDLSIDISLNSTFELDCVEHFADENNIENHVADEFIDHILSFYLKHNLSLVGLEDEMKLLNAKKSDCAELPTNKEAIIELFHENRDVFQVYFFVKCDKCNKYTKCDAKKKQKSMCIYCGYVLKKSETNFFVTIPIEQQIRQSIQTHWKLISEFATRDTTTGTYSDARDGKILKSVLAQYEGTDINILSLCLNLDGANKFKSNKMSLWPLQFLQNYLPPSIRFQTRNIIVGGFYYGSKKLCCREYLLPLIQELNHLKHNNMMMNIDDEDYTFKPIITHCSVDLPAKSMLQQTKQFGSYDGCTYCEVPGELVKIKPIKKQKAKKKTNNNQNTGVEGIIKENKFVRYVESAEPYKLRDETETLKRMLEAAKSANTTVKGIKDISCLVGLEHFNIIHSFSVEIMHCCLLGTEKRLLNYFLNPNFSKCNFYINNDKKKLLNTRSYQSSHLRILCESRDQWNNDRTLKPASLDHFFYFICQCDLQGVLPVAYVKHIQRFSAALYILLKESISDEEVNEAERLLNVFVKEHQILFGKEAMVMVVHLLKHLAESVRQLGPVWCHSAFSFERNNGCLLKLVRGTSDVLLQASTKYTLSKALNQKKKVTVQNKILLGRKVKVVEKVLYVHSIGSGKTLNFSNVSLSVHKRIRLGKIIYTSLLYTRPKRSIDYFIGLKDGTFGMAEFYFKQDEQIYVIMKEFESIGNVNHILKVEKTDRSLMAPIDDIVVKYLYMKVALSEYIVSEPNPYENE